MWGEYFFLYSCWLSLWSVSEYLWTVYSLWLSCCCPFPPFCPIRNFPFSFFLSLSDTQGKLLLLRPLESQRYSVGGRLQPWEERACVFVSLSCEWDSFPPSPWEKKLILWKSCLSANWDGKSRSFSSLLSSSSSYSRHLRVSRWSSSSAEGQTLSQLLCTFDVQGWVKTRVRVNSQ